MLFRPMILSRGKFRVQINFWPTTLFIYARGYSIHNPHLLFTAPLKKIFLKKYMGFT